ncbi:MAG: contractile injection system protein, VgrG/Pvc8 family [Rhodobacteraceae bacterium]|nr:contractile injection system protein, VgrG/Pvc8 family [Paracoccaceae bacterium]MCW9041757.1 contractile injection system protein, VgrG/Pvc8 family [Pseudopelagicola sp.]
MKLAFRIIADGSDVTEKFQDRLVSLTVTDESGQKSDRAEIAIDDRDNLVSLPETGAKLEIALGLEGKLVELGTFVVDDLSGNLTPATMQISAKAADMLGGIRARKTRSWRDVTVLNIVEKIAAEQGLVASVAESLKSVRFSYLAQTSESDLNFLTRMARDLDAVAKPAGGYLVLVKRGEGKTPTGKPLPVFKVDISQIQRGSWKITGRGQHGRVCAEWGERGTAQRHKVIIGKDEPQLNLRHPFATKEEAERAAKAALDRGKRASGSINIDLGGFWGELMAEAKVDLSGVKPELTGEWLITQVSHRLSNTLQTSFRAERDNKGSGS